MGFGSDAARSLAYLEANISQLDLHCWMPSKNIRQMSWLEVRQNNTGYICIHLSYSLAVISLHHALYMFVVKACYWLVVPVLSLQLSMVCWFQRPFESTKSTSHGKAKNHPDYLPLFTHIYPRYLLVGGLEHVLFLHILGIIIPTD